MNRQSRFVHFSEISLYEYFFENYSMLFRLTEFDEVWFCRNLKDNITESSTTDQFALGLRYWSRLQLTDASPLAFMAISIEEVNYNKRIV